MSLAFSVSSGVNAANFLRNDPSAAARRAAGAFMKAPTALWLSRTTSPVRLTNAPSQTRLNCGGISDTRSCCIVSGRSRFSSLPVRSRNARLHRSISWKTSCVEGSQRTCAGLPGSPDMALAIMACRISLGFRSGFAEAISAARPET